MIIHVLFVFLNLNLNLGVGHLFLICIIIASLVHFSHYFLEVNGSQSWNTSRM